MGKKDNILENNPSLKQRPYDVPQGYFEALRGRLSEIPRSGGIVVVPLWQKVRPYMALAAAFAAIVVAGTAILRSSASRLGAEAEDIGLAALVPYTSPYSIYDSEALGQMDELTEEDYANFLIASGISAEHVAYTAYYENNR